MTNPRDDLVNPRRRLPDLALASAAGTTHRLHTPGRRSPVRVLVHPGACPACATFLGRLAAASAALREWDGDVRVITPDAINRNAPPSTSIFPLLHDPEQRVATALGITPPAVVIADQWGEVHDLREAGEEHRFPSAEEVESWLRYLAIQCPECQGETL